MDEIVVNPPERETHPEGQFAAICVDIIDLGMKVSEKWNKASETCVFIFQTDEKMSSGRRHSVTTREFSLSLSEKSNLRKFLEQWRGKAYSPEQLGKSFRLTDCGHTTAMLSIAHEISKDGSRTYANISSIMPLPKTLTAPEPDYVRGDFWAKRKAEYLSAYQKFMLATLKNEPLAAEEPASAELHDDEDAPF